nr:PREDICTED: keratinocyte proline-rich protein-like [Bemisia tabaci]
MRVMFLIVVSVFFINYSFINGLKGMISGGFQSLRKLSSNSYGSIRSFSGSKFSFRSDSPVTDRTDADRESWQAQRSASGVTEKMKKVASFGSASLKALASGVVDGVRRRTSRQGSQEFKFSDGDIDLCYELLIGTELQLPKSTCTIVSPCFPEQDVAHTVEISSSPRCMCTPTPRSSPRRSPTGSPRGSPTGSPSRSPPRGKSDSPRSRSPERSRSSSTERRRRTSPDRTVKTPPEILGQKSPEDLPRNGVLKKKSKQSPGGSRNVSPVPTLQFTDTPHFTQIPSSPNKPLPPPGPLKPSISLPKGLIELPKTSPGAAKTSPSKKWSPPKTPQKSPPKSPPKPSPKSPPKPVDPQWSPPPRKILPNLYWRREMERKGIPESQLHLRPRPPAPLPPPPPEVPPSPPRMFKLSLANWRDLTGIGQRMKHFVPTAAPNIDPNDPHQVAYAHMQNRLLKYFTMDKAPNKESFLQELDDLHDEQFKPQAVDQQTRSRKWIEKHCGPLRDEDRVALINAPRVKRYCKKRCNKMWGFAFVPSSEEAPMDPAEFFACGRLVPITKGDVRRRDPEPYLDEDLRPVFACNCDIDSEFNGLMRIDSAQFSRIKNHSTVQNAVDWLRLAFQGTGVYILSHAEYEMQWGLLFDKRKMPNPAQNAQHRADQGKAAGGEDDEEADEHYWENMKFYRKSSPPHPTRAPSTL